jgi:membrane protein DedA with SNARE-associated domain
MRPIALAAAALVLAGAMLRRRRLARLQLAALAGLAAALAVYGGGLVDLPDVESSLREIGPTLGQWMYLLVAVLAFLETGAFVGLAVPGELTIVIGGFVAGQGEILLAVLVPLVWVAAVCGDVASYWLGRRLGRGFVLRHGGRFGVTPARLGWAEQYFSRHGGKTVLAGRFIGLVRAFAPFLAGASRMPFGRFLAVDVIGAGLWAAPFCLLGFVFWQSFDRVVELAGRGQLVVGVVLGLAAAAYLAHRRLWRGVPPVS